MLTFQTIGTSLCLWFSGLVTCWIPISDLSWLPYRKPIQQQPSNKYSSRSYTRTFSKQSTEICNFSRKSDQSHQGCGFRISFAFQQLLVVLSAINHLLLSCLQARQVVFIYPRHPRVYRSVTLPKTDQFSSLFPGQQNLDRASHKRTRSAP